MKARIGYLTYALDRPGGGVGTYTRELLLALRSLGVDLAVFQSGGGGKSAETTIRLHDTGLLPGLLTLGQAEIGFQVFRGKLPLIHDPTGVAPVGFVRAKRVVTIYDAFPYVIGETSTALERLVYRLWLPLILPSVDAVITISHHSKRDILRHLPLIEEKITVTYLAAHRRYRIMEPAAVATTLARIGIREPYILYVGSIAPRKNLVRLVEAYARLRECSTNWQLVIVGAKNFHKSNAVAEAVERLGLKGHVVFLGYIPEEELPALYNGADLFVFPSLYEGFGLPVLEAMACGTPVVTSNLSSLPEIAGQAALLINPYDVSAIAAAMGRALMDEALAAELRGKSLARAAQFSWEHTALETLSVYQAVMG